MFFTFTLVLLVLLDVTIIGVSVAVLCVTVTVQAMSIHSCLEMMETASVRERDKCAPPASNPPVRPSVVSAVTVSRELKWRVYPVEF